MFEKEAEEYSVGKAHEHYNYLFEENAGSPVDFARWCFQDGAEFGYNKAKVEVEDSYKESLCNSELNLTSVTEQLEELEKANEWHKADVPTTPINKVVLGYIKYYNSKKFCLVKWNGEWWYDASTWNDKVKLIAWKEIVLPKESE